MRPEASEKIYRLVDFLDLLEGLQEAGLEFTAIGGCAVGAYAERVSADILSGDLDLYASPDVLTDILRYMQAHGGVVHKRPQPRNIPVAFVEWQGKVVDILTDVLGLPEPDVAIQTAREFQFGNVSVLVADPFLLLANKLAVRRDKDLPHIDILLRFITEEIVTEFTEAERPRDRIAPAKRLLRITGKRYLEPDLVERLIPLARDPVDWRFLAQVAPDAEVVLAKASPQLLPELREIAERQG